MSETGGTPGSNQPEPDGRSHAHQPTSHTLPRPDPPSLTGPDIQAVTHPILNTASLELVAAHVHPRGVERAVRRWQTRLPNLIWNDAALEGSLVTLPDVTTVLDGGSPAGYDDHDIDQVIDLSQAAHLVNTLAHEGPHNPTNDLSSTLNHLIVAHEVIEPGILRGEGTIGGTITVNVLGTTFWPTPAGLPLRQAFTHALSRVSTIAHPVARATAWAAFATYHQFYSNGNKRTARYVMNTVLLSHGFDAILTPANRRADYNRSLQDMYHTGDLTQHALFLTSLYDDSHDVTSPEEEQHASE